MRRATSEQHLRKVFPPNHYLVTFNYAPLPSLNDLKEEFLGGVSDSYDGRGWRKHALAVVAGEKPGRKIVWISEPPAKLLNDSEKIIAWGYRQRTEVAPNGYRPLMGQNELLDLHRAHPELYKQYWMAALGSFTFGGGLERYVAVLRAAGAGPMLDDHSFDIDWLDLDWHAGRHFPLILI